MQTTTKRKPKKSKTKGPRTPQIRVHRRSRRAYVELSGQTHWLGADNDPARFAAFAEVVAQWEGRGRAPLVDATAPDALTAGELVARYRAHVEAKRGAEWLSPKGHGCRVHYALDALVRLYGTAAAVEVGPVKIKNVRAALIAGKQWPGQRSCCRREANARTQALVRLYNWAASEELIPAALAHAVACIEPIGEGDRTARDNAPREAADADAVAAVLPFLPPVPRAIVRLLQLTGARPSEIARLRVGDFDTSDPDQWVATLTEHKCAHHGKARVLVFESEAIEILRPRMRRRRADAYLFTPQDSEHEFRERLSAEFAAARGEAAEAPPRAEVGARRWRPHYDANALRLAVARACAACNRDRAAKRLPAVAPFSPYGLRHLHATEIALVATEADATLLLGHASAATTKRYLHHAAERARQASRRVREAQQAEQQTTAAAPTTAAG